tara:strand:- start:3289 stop:3687 length:399 start_codon:yes stop_codon:yes gene_type:complete
MVDSKKISISEDDIQGSGSFVLEAGDYEGKVVSVKDHLSEAGNEGWVWEIEAMGTMFKMWTMFTKSSKWKLIEVMKSLHVELKAGEMEFNPDNYIGKPIGIEIDKEEGSDYFNIVKTFPIKVTVEAPKDSAF